MRPSTQVRLTLLSLLAALPFASPVLAADARQPAAFAKEPTEVKPVNQWGGSVDDLTLQREAPEGGVVTGEKIFSDLWRAWNVGGEVPRVDFAQHLVLVETTRGSRLRVTARLTDDGDLKVLALATRDLRPGFRYQILVVPREGVKTVNGKLLP